MQQTVGAMQRTVAIVDDDPHISEALGLWVELQGLRALHFTSAEALLSVIHEGQHPLTVPSQKRRTSFCPVIFPHSSPMSPS